MAPKVYSYIRWSTPAQREGDSFRRQLEKTRAFAFKAEMELDESLRDDGVSAFRGRNMRKGARAGALGRFLERVELGEIEENSILVVEDLDRMSRQAPDRALSGFLEIIHAGIAVHTTNDRRTYRDGALDLPHLIGALLGFAKANGESETKRGRLQDVWAEKRRNAAERPMTAKGPAWLKLNGEAGAWDVLEDRAEIIRHIYREAVAGKGPHRIAADLNRAGVPTFDRGASTAKMWTRSYVVRLLDTRAVVGTMVPKVMTYDANGRQRRVEQPAQSVEGYYPAIVDPDLYAQVRALRDSTPSPLRGKAAITDTKNIFGGLLRCARCGGAMHRRSRRDTKTGKLYEYVGCRTAINGAGCVFQLVRYELLEDGFRQQAGEIIASIPLGDGGEALRDALATLDAKAEALGHIIADYRERLATQYDRTTADELAGFARERNAVEQESEEARKQAAAAAGPFLTHRLSELSAALDADPIDRAAANALLRTLTESASLDLDTGFLSITWKAGGVSEVPVLAQAFGFTVEPTWAKKDKGAKGAKSAAKTTAKKTTRAAKAKATAARR